MSEYHPGDRGKEETALFLVKLRTTFCAAMRLSRPELSDEENFALYGVCSNPSFHGHNFDVEVAVAGELDPNTRMVVNFYEIEQLLRREIFEKVDHKNLNTDVDFLQGLVPTTETLALKFWERLEPHITTGRLYSISVGERDTNIVIYYGPNVPVPAPPVGAAAPVVMGR